MASAETAGERFTPYRRMVRAQVRAQASYRASFWVEAVISTFATWIDLFAVVVLFRVTKTLGGFGFADAFLMSSLASLGFATADLAVGNIETLGRLVRLGQLDTMLVRPLGLLRQILATDVQIRRLGRIVVAAIALAAATVWAHLDWTPGTMALVVAAPLAAAVFFGAVYVISASVAFWWIDSGEFANGFTYGGRDFTSYPVTVYGTAFRRLFAYGLGFAFVAYYPALALLRRPDPLGLPGWTGWISPAVAAPAAALAALAWRSGVRHYRSTGS